MEPYLCRLGINFLRLHIRILDGILINRYLPTFRTENHKCTPEFHIFFIAKWVFFIKCLCLQGSMCVRGHMTQDAIVNQNMYR